MQDVKDQYCPLSWSIQIVWTWQLLILNHQLVSAPRNFRSHWYAIQLWLQAISPKCLDPMDKSMGNNNRSDKTKNLCENFPPILAKKWTRTPLGCEQCVCRRRISRRLICIAINTLVNNFNGTLSLGKYPMESCLSWAGRLTWSIDVFIINKKYSNYVFYLFYYYLKTYWYLIPIWKYLFFIYD